MSDQSPAKAHGPLRVATPEQLQSAASGSAPGAAVTLKPESARTSAPNAGELAKALLACGDQQAPTGSCKVILKIALFFDGTGNNLDADVRTQEHSNVARLFQAHPEDDEATHEYVRYIPGLGTYFKEIGDPGGDTAGKAFGAKGEDRLVWAMKEVDQIIKKYIPTRIIGLRFALFGFSRGAALARAFALRLQERCEGSSTSWRWKDLRCPSEIYFMGLFDTVASVGLPASSGLDSLSIGQGYTTLERGLASRRRDSSTGLDARPVHGSTKTWWLHGIAQGDRPGAIPADGFFTGHGAWADNLRLPPMTRRCVHYTAAHEIRNSFPLDSVREGLHYPRGIDVDERVYPGAHSNVGGGYRPGEGGKSPVFNSLLSLIPLSAMLHEARRAGVPLTQPEPDDFATSPELSRRFNAYMNHPGIVGQRSVEGHLLAHMRLFYAWRFHVIRRNRKAGQRPEAADLNAREAAWAKEGADLDRQIAEAERSPTRQAALQEQARARKELDDALFQDRQIGSSNPYWTSPDKQASRLRVQRANEQARAADARFIEADDPRARLVAKKSTLPSGGQVDLLNRYDAQLMLDVKSILDGRAKRPDVPLRPHYAGLIEAYEAEFTHNRGLLSEHPDALAFFELYVHDSLAGFAKDATLPSDPRVVFIGGDTKSQFARSQSTTKESQAA